MIKRTTALLTVVLAALTACSQADRATTSPLAPQASAAMSAGTNGFNEFGYNYSARIFVGRADGVDKVLDGMVWGDPTYANDHLVMKWNKAWDDCNANRSDATCAGAWTNNEWNGRVAGGSGENWVYKTIWSADCKNGVALTDGGYCIWGQYEVIFSQGSEAGQHFWEANAHVGYGGK